MINKRALLDFARHHKLEARIIEKDYVLGWMLAGINAHQSLRDDWVFKGGTCLKKCCIDTQRFSEDLDFTLCQASQIDVTFLTRVFGVISDWIYEKSGIEIPKDTISFDRHPELEKLYVEGRVGYEGPLGRNRGNVSKIKLDLTANEILVCPPVERAVSHPYTDFNADDFHIFCYSSEELVAEKVRALAQRLRPRDLFDLIQIYKGKTMTIDRSTFTAILQKKCLFKGIAVPTFEALETHPHRNELEADWDRMLKHQVANLAPVAEYWTLLPAALAWLYGA